MPIALNCTICGASFLVIPSRATTAKYCRYRCHQIGEGRKGGITRGKQIQAADQGKTYVKTGGRHTHRAVAEQKLGRALLPGEVVHHKDGNKRNNALENLEVLTNQSEHAKLHVAEMLRKRKERCGY